MSFWRKFEKSPSPTLLLPPIVDFFLSALFYLYALTFDYRQKVTTEKVVFLLALRLFCASLSKIYRFFVSVSLSYKLLDALQGTAYIRV